MQISGFHMDLAVSEVMGQEMWTFSKHPWDILRYPKVWGFPNWIFPLSRHYLEPRQEQVWWQREPSWSLCPALHQMPAFVLPLGPSHSGCSMCHTCPTASLPRSGYGSTTHLGAQARELAVIRITHSKLFISYWIWPISPPKSFSKMSPPHLFPSSTPLDNDFHHLNIHLRNIYPLITYCLVRRRYVPRRKEARER